VRFSRGRYLRPPTLLLVDPEGPSTAKSASQGAPDGPETASDEPKPNKPLGFELKLDPGHPYLAERCIPPSLVERFGLG
jgi:hypothetical protein